ncbi:MAG: orotidine-5'-phosphate decarboxylase [Patescibacteria group bacterium]
MARKILTPNQRLIVAADFPLVKDDPSSPIAKLKRLCQQITLSQAAVKVNSLQRREGQGLIDVIHSYGLSAFADLKLIDIGGTMMIDGQYLREVRPEFLTVMCHAGVKNMRRLKEMLPDTEILGVTVLTDQTEEDVQRVNRCSIEEAVRTYALMAKEAGIDGLIASPSEAKMLRELVGDDITINTPAIRPIRLEVANDDQNLQRAKTPQGAFEAGADRIIVGRPITQAENSQLAIAHTLEEIAECFA